MFFFSSLFETFCRCLKYPNVLHIKNNSMHVWNDVEWVDKVWIFILWMNYPLKSYASMSTVFIFEQMWTALRDAVFFQMGAITGWNAGVLLKYDCDIPLHSVETCSNGRVVFYFVWQAIFLQAYWSFSKPECFLLH